MGAIEQRCIRNDQLDGKDRQAGSSAGGEWGGLAVASPRPSATRRRIETMYDRIRSFLFRIEAERTHALTLNLLRLTGKVRPAHWLISQIYKAPQKPVEAFGLTFKNPVGLAAGYDKDCMAIRGLDSLGFGHIEIGTITPMPQPGNPAPRMFRLLEDQAINNG